MKYSLNRREINISIDQETVRENNLENHHNEMIHKELDWFPNGYIAIDVQEDFLNPIREKSLEYINNCIEQNGFDRLSELKKYHRQIKTDKDHQRVLRTVGKVIKPQLLAINVEYLANQIKRFCKIQEDLGCFDACDIRIFRPFNGQTMDNNPLHRDTWLRVLNNCINVYIPVAGNSRLNSLSLIPGSHLWNREKVERTVSNACINGVQYGLPSVTAINGKYKLIRPALRNNEILLFSSDLIHGGAVNLSRDTTRVSIEMRFWPSRCLNEVAELVANM